MDTQWNNVPSDVRSALGVMDGLARSDHQIRAVYLLRATIAQNAEDSKRIKALEQAIAIEIERVSMIEYPSRSICKHFMAQFKKRADEIMRGGK